MLGMSWLNEIEKLESYLARVSFIEKRGKYLEADEGFAIWRDWAIELRKKRNVCYLIGNGASASIASHMACDLAKNALLHTQVFSDLSLVTAMGNDLGYDFVYSEPLKARGEKGDLLVAISSSGESQNILNAVSTASKLGIKVVTLSAMNKNNRLRASGDINIHIEAQDYGHAETCHAAILHYWMDIISRAVPDE